MNVTCDSPLQAAKEELPIPALWQLLNLPGKPARSCRSPFREDRNPELFDLRRRPPMEGPWDGAGRDADFRAAAGNLSKAEGARKLIELAGTGHKATPDLDSDGGY